ncbi:hypothetical protein [Pendulispora albinea]|uniref:HEAT repeat domain-containing protein n=1 Tax=Pendulispora albinea TaxID=2741071 RepID=A0ABZ2M347_9BACT
MATFAAQFFLDHRAIWGYAMRRRWRAGPDLHPHERAALVLALATISPLANEVLETLAERDTEHRLVRVACMIALGTAKHPLSQRAAAALRKFASAPRIPARFPWRAFLLAKIDEVLVAR